MTKKYVLCVEYATGKASMIVSTPDLFEALQVFVKDYAKALPDTKMYGMPAIQKVEIYPLLYQKGA